MKISGWGNHIAHEAKVLSPLCYNDAQNSLSQQTSNHLIPRGQGLSYGDSALSDIVISSRYLTHLLEFDIDTGVITCQSGVLFEQILSVIVPHGWFLPVVPGTQKISLGGAIASDIHGKNHHVDGSFCNYVQSLDLLTASGEIITCTPSKNKTLFLATCGGMGLTGIIVQATITLKPIKSSFMQQSTWHANNLVDTLDSLNQQNDDYSVCWLDLTRLPSINSLIMSAKHDNNSALQLSNKRPISIPFLMPSFTINKPAIKLFNSIYYAINKRKTTQLVHYQSFFFALDSIGHWNRLYGAKGFTQYQFVLPKDSAQAGLNDIFKALQQTNNYSTLAVLKNFGPANDNYLSFPMEGITLAMDFKINNETKAMLKQLDNIIVEHGGRIYLSKDDSMSQATFIKTYPNLNKFVKIRNQWAADTKFNSLQSQRLGLN